MASQSTRLLALNKARDTGQAVSTGRIQLVQESTENSGYLVFMPVYRNDAAVNTVSQRRKELKGFVLAVYHIRSTIEFGLSSLKTQSGNIKLTVSVVALEIKINFYLLQKIILTYRTLMNFKLKTISKKAWCFRLVHSMSILNRILI